MATQLPADGAVRPPLPLFYRSPEPLSSQRHVNWKLKAGDAAFAADTGFVPIVAGEFAAAQHHYPIVFAADNDQPLVLTGLGSRNLFISEGRWAEGGYVPAYIRRYPFVFIATANPDGFALAIDTASDRVADGGEEGEPLFHEGEPTELTKQALAFCDAFQAEAAATRAFTEALSAAGLLIERRADATLPDGRRLGVDGFRIVDGEKFAALADELVVDWHRKGWLALVHFHLGSLERFSALLGKQSALQPTAATEVVQ